MLLLNGYGRCSKTYDFRNSVQILKHTTRELFKKAFSLSEI